MWADRQGMTGVIMNLMAMKKYLKYYACMILMITGLLGFKMLLSAPVDSAGASTSCASVEDQAEAAGREVKAMTDELGTGPYDRLPVGKWALRDRTYVATEQLLRMIVNSPECFSASSVATAQTRLRQFTQR